MRFSTLIEPGVGFLTPVKKTEQLSKMKAIFGRYGKLAFASVGAVSTSMFVAHCATPNSKPMPWEIYVNKNYKSHIGPVDFAPTTVWDSNWDRSDPRFMKHKVWQDPKDNKKNDDDDANLKYPTARRNIILVRHGQYNQKGDKDECHTLTKLGEEQAALAGKRLAATGIKFSSIISSGMSRAIQTAEIMLKEMETNYPKLKLEIKDQILNEGPPCPCEPEYRNKELWDPDFNEFYAEGARIEAAFRKYFHRADLDQKEDSFEIIVCHANVIRYFTMRALQFPPEGWLRISLDHTSVTRISLLPNGDVILRGLGDSGHLPPDKNTT